MHALGETGEAASGTNEVERESSMGTALQDIRSIGIGHIKLDGSGEMERRAIWMLIGLLSQEGRYGIRIRARLFHRHSQQL
jgi:hypothetical protein